jgi:hypothetical protein
LLHFYFVTPILSQLLVGAPSQEHQAEALFNPLAPMNRALPFLL